MSPGPDPDDLTRVRRLIAAEEAELAAALEAGADLQAECAQRRIHLEALRELEAAVLQRGGAA